MLSQALRGVPSLAEVLAVGPGSVFVGLADGPGSDGDALNVSPGSSIIDGLAFDEVSLHDHKAPIATTAMPVRTARSPTDSP
jgi:hypothetical protein